MCTTASPPGCSTPRPCRSSSSAPRKGSYRRPEVEPDDTVRAINALDIDGQMKEAYAANQIGNDRYPGEASKARENEP